MHKSRRLFLGCKRLQHWSILSSETRSSKKLRSHKDVIYKCNVVGCTRQNIAHTIFKPKTQLIYSQYMDLQERISLVLDRCCGRVENIQVVAERFWVKKNLHHNFANSAPSVHWCALVQGVVHSVGTRGVFVSKALKRRILDVQWLP